MKTFFFLSLSCQQTKHTKKEKKDNFLRLDSTFFIISQAN